MYTGRALTLNLLLPSHAVQFLSGKRFGKGQGQTDTHSEAESEEGLGPVLGPS